MEEIKAVAFEKDELKYRENSKLLPFSANSSPSKIR